MNMPSPPNIINFDLNDPSGWLTSASAINIAWHNYERYLRETPPSNPQLYEYYQSLTNALRTQKENALLSALNIAYHNAKIGKSHDLWLFFDVGEKGFDGLGEFYRLTWQNQPKNGCHLPKDFIDECLTDTQKAYWLKSD